MNYFSLTKTTPDVLQKIEESERKGIFSEHLDPIDYSNALPVDENFNYILKGHQRRKYTREDWLIVKPFSYIVNKHFLKTRVTGRKNIRGIKGAIVTCNHVNKLDALACMHALKGRKFKVTVADFNNQKGRLGDYMRAAGIMPFSSSMSAMRNFNKSLSYFLKKGTYILFFPERSEWWCYEKPRPYMDGAYHYAIVNKVPVIPIFITFNKTGKYYDNGIEKRQFIVNILEPIYPDFSLPKKENVEYMKKRNYELCKKKYEEFYGKKLEYSCGKINIDK
jgi:1-acyl-sn-glycerol-3-phosphate acyltransferase